MVFFRSLDLINDRKLCWQEALLLWFIIINKSVSLCNRWKISGEPSLFYAWETWLPAQGSAELLREWSPNIWHMPWVSAPVSYWSRLDQGPFESWGRGGSTPRRISTGKWIWCSLAHPNFPALMHPSELGLQVYQQLMSRPYLHETCRVTLGQVALWHCHLPCKVAVRITKGRSSFELLGGRRAGFQSHVIIAVEVTIFDSYIKDGRMIPLRLAASPSMAYGKCFLLYLRKVKQEGIFFPSLS